MAKHDDKSTVRSGEVQANVAIAFLVLAWFFISLRVFTRTYVIVNFGWDDSTMIVAGMLFTVYCGAMLYLDANGGGTHIDSVTEMLKLTKFAIVGEATYLLTIMMLKISLGIFFARIVVKKWQLWTIYITVAGNIVSSGGSFFYVLLRCGTNLDLYVYRQLAYNCTSNNLDRFFAYQQASITTLTDCIFATLPVIILWNAQMSTRSKLSVGLILSLGAGGSVCSMVRFKYVEGLTERTFFWNATNIAIWSTIEPGAGIVAGCLATLRPLLKRFFVKARSIRSSTRSSTKETSRSFPWSDDPSNRSSDTRPSDKAKSHESSNSDMYNCYVRDIEKKSDTSTKVGSTDCIFPRLDADGLSHSHLGHSLEQTRSRTISDTSHSSTEIRHVLPV